MSLQSQLKMAEQQILALRERVEELTAQATTDSLTGLLNRRGVERALVEAAHLEERYGTPSHLLMLDLDHFKSVNDTPGWGGHSNGDRVLKEVAKVLQRNVRVTDKVGRWGGEEFVVVVHAPAGDIMLVAEKLRDAVEQAVRKDPAGRTPQTVSIGVGVSTTEADHSLYFAKQAGRNMVVFHLTSPRA